MNYTRKAYTKKDYCEICKTNTTRLVIDHNHLTGLIRGTLCKICNVRLGTFESSKVFSLSKKYVKWFKLYKEIAVVYMQQETNLVYSERQRNEYERRIESC